MTGTWIIALLSALLAAVPLQDAQTNSEKSPEQRRAEFEAKKRERAEAFARKNARQHGYIVKHGTPHIVLPLPQPITKDELAHLGGILELSDAQMKHFDALHEQYLDDGWSWRKPNVQPLYDRSAELAAASQQQRATMQWAQQVNALFAECYDIAPTLESFDTKLLEAIRPFLSETQHANLGRAMKLRQRQRARVQTPTYLGSRFDLTEVLFERQQDGRDMTPDDPEHFRHLLIDYENEATNLFRQFADHHRRVGEERRIIGAQQQQLGRQVQQGLATREEVMPDYLALEERKEKFRRKGFTIERRLHELNDRYIALLAEQLPDETGDELMTWWREEVYRYIWPDPFALDELLKAARRIDGLTEDQQTAVEGAAIEYDTRRDALTDAMMSEFTQWNDQVEGDNTYLPIDYEPYAERMMKLQNQRRENAQKTIERLRNVLSDEQFAALEDELARYEEYVRIFEDCLDRLKQRNLRWPGPHSRSIIEPHYPHQRR